MRIRAKTATALALATTLIAGTNTALANHESNSACGWYAISVCSKSYNSAQNGADKYGGYVIHTSDTRYPNFHNGRYGSVQGPSSKSQARSVKNDMRHYGAKTAYIKNAC